MSKLTPAAALVLKHLEMHGSITPLEGLMYYRIQDVAGRVCEVRKKLAGTLHEVASVICKDALGARFTRYTLREKPVDLAWAGFTNPSVDPIVEIRHA